MKAVATSRRRPAARIARNDWLIGTAGALVLAAALVLGAVLARPGAPLPQAVVQEALPWSALRPAHLQPAVAAIGPELARLRDADPRATEMLRRLRAAADREPAVAALDGRPVALLGYVVPLDGRDGDAFLLVPYFGACIHTPPPPANQVVHVTGRDAMRLRTMDRVLVRGVLRVQHGAHAVAASSYAIHGAEVVVH